MGSWMSKTGMVRSPRAAMPMTSLTWTSRQARTQAPQAMQASRLTAMAGLEMSTPASTWPALANFDPSRSLPMVFLGPEIPIDDAQRPQTDRLSGPSPARTMLLARSSNTMERAFAARSLPVSPPMPSLRLLLTEAARTRSPSL